MSFIKPTIVVSKCLGFENCRYNGNMSKSSLVQKLIPLCNVITVCPEVEINLGIPREPIRLVDENGGIKVIQHKTNRDVTRDLNEFSSDFLSNLKEVDGFILKAKSPSCGINDVKVYFENNKGVSRRESGLFSINAKNIHEKVPIETDGRLSDYKIRDNFLTKLFILGKFRRIKNNIEDVIDFHNENTILYKSYNKTKLKSLDKIIEKINQSEDAIKEYENELDVLFSKSQRQDSTLSILKEFYDKFQGKLSLEENEFIADVLLKYYEKLVPLSVPIYLFKGLAVRFNDKYMLKQSFFNPYPDELIDTTTYKNI